MFNQLLEFRNQKLLVQALSNKIHETEYFQKTGKPYQYGNNEEFSIDGQQLIEFYFYDYMLLQGFPNQQSQFKKPSDIIQLRQRLINDKYLSEIATLLNLQNLISVGNQKSLKYEQLQLCQKQSKGINAVIYLPVLSDCIKSIIGAHYYDKQNDLEVLRDLIHPIIAQLLNKGQEIGLTKWKYNPKSSFLEFLNQYKGQLDINPKLTIEWKKEDTVLNQNNSYYQITLELNIDKNEYSTIVTRKFKKSVLIKEKQNKMYTKKLWFILENQIQRKMKNRKLQKNKQTQNKSMMNLNFQHPSIQQQIIKIYLYIVLLITMKINKTQILINKLTLYWRSWHLSEILQPKS